MFRRLAKKMHTLRHMSWRWAYRYYTKKLTVHIGYAISKICRRTSWSMTIEGITVRFAFSNPYQHHIARIYHRAAHEPQLLRLWKRQVEEYGGVIFDLGGYTGVFGLLAGAANPKARVFIFEPDPVNIEQIKRNIAVNNLTNVTAVHTAIADTTGVVSFTVSYKGSAEAGGGTGGAITKSGGEYHITCTSIDAWVRETRCAAPTLIKMDIEGAEYRALFGGRKTLTETNNVKILLEVHPQYLERLGDSEQKVHALLTEMNYDAAWLDADRFCTHYWVYQKNSGSLP